MPQKIVVASGYFDPIHPGHIEYLQRAKKLGDKLIVIVNNDHQARLKKGFVVMSAKERIKLVREIMSVDAVIESVDDDRTVCKTLKLLHPDIFAKGGDQTIGTIPEAKVCKENDIQIIDGLGDKIQSSRKLIGEMIKNIKDADPKYFEE